MGLNTSSLLVKIQPSGRSSLVLTSFHLSAVQVSVWVILLCNLRNGGRCLHYYKGKWFWQNIYILAFAQSNSRINPLCVERNSSKKIKKGIKKNPTFAVEGRKGRHKTEMLLFYLWSAVLMLTVMVMVVFHDRKPLLGRHIFRCMIDLHYHWLLILFFWQRSQQSTLLKEKARTEWERRYQHHLAWPIPYLLLCL